MSEQYAEDASQKFTVPGLTVALPEVTVAVSITTLPEVKEVTALPAGVTASVVVVVVVAAGADNDDITTAKNNARSKNAARRTPLALSSRQLRLAIR
jgi:hypothetical protein